LIKVALNHSQLVKLGEQRDRLGARLRDHLLLIPLLYFFLTDNRQRACPKIF
jgi:hypothetical protein